MRGCCKAARSCPRASARASREPRYSELRAGSRWSKALPPEALRAIRQETLNPALRAGGFADGVAATLAALDARIANTSTFWGTATSWLPYAVVLAFIGFFASLLFDDQVRWLKKPLAGVAAGAAAGLALAADAAGSPARRKLSAVSARAGAHPAGARGRQRPPLVPPGGLDQQAQAADRLPGPAAPARPAAQAPGERKDHIGGADSGSEPAGCAIPCAGQRCPPGSARSRRPPSDGGASSYSSSYTTSTSDYTSSSSSSYDPSQLL